MRAASHHRWVLDAIPPERVPLGIRCPRCRYPLEDRDMPTTCPECGQHWSKHDLVGTRAKELSNWHKYVSWLGEYCPSVRTWAIIVLCLGLFGMLALLGWNGLDQFCERIGFNIFRGMHELCGM